MHVLWLNFYFQLNDNKRLALWEFVAPGIG